MKRERAALYGRLSKEDIDKLNGGDDSESIKNQRLLLTDYALEKGFEIVDWYYDDDYSGLYSDRPGFERLIADAQNKKFDIVIAKSQSRFTRNMEHMEKYLHTMFPILGIRFIGVVDNADTAVASNKKARQINGLINEWYCEDLSENIKSVFKAKMRAGQYIASHPPYGYIKNPENTHTLIIDEYAAGIVRRIFNMYISGMGKGAIGAQLTKEGILIPSEYKKQVLKMNYHNAHEAIYSKLWSYQTIHTILNNEAYTGVMIQSRFSTVSYKSKKKVKVPEKDWIKIPNAYEPIIDNNTWEIAQSLQKSRTRSVNSEQKIGLFTGLLRCSDCKKPMSRAYHRRTHEFTGYCCSTYKKFGNQFCSQHGIKEDELKQAVLFEIKKVANEILTRNDIEELNSFDPENILNGNDFNEKTKEIIQDKISRIDKYLKKAYENFVEQILDKDEFLELKNQYNKEKQELLKQIQEIDNIIFDKKSSQKEHNQWIKRFKNYMDVDELTREMVLELIERIEIGNDKDVHIYFKFANPKTA